MAIYIFVGRPLFRERSEGVKQVPGVTYFMQML